MQYINIYVIDFPDKFAAKDDLWIIGDEFVAKHMKEQLIRQPERCKVDNYTASNFDVYTAATTGYGSNKPKCYITLSQLPRTSY